MTHESGYGGVQEPKSFDFDHLKSTYGHQKVEPKHDDPKAYDTTPHDASYGQPHEQSYDAPHDPHQQSYDAPHDPHQ